MKYSNAEISDLPPKIREIIKGNIKEGKITRGIVFSGITGSGKTHALYAIRKALKRYETRTSEVENWTGFLFDLKERFGSGLGVRLQDLSEKKYLFIDDLGVESDGDWGKEMLYLVVNKAYIKDSIFFISTNLSPNELIAKYGERIMDRLSDTCDFVEMPKHNYRK